MNKNVRIWKFVILISFSIVITACNKDNTASEKANEKKLLNQYLQSNYPGLQPTASGLYYISLKDGNGIQADTGDYAMINYTGWLIDNTTVVTTSDSATAKANKFYASGYLYGPYKIRIGYYMPYILVPSIVTGEGVSKMKQGGTSKMIVTSDLAYGGNQIGVVNPYSTIIYNIDLVEVIKDPVAREKQMITHYLDSLRQFKFFNYNSIDSMSNGLVYIPKTIGTGNSPAANSTVIIKYTEKYLDGRILSATADSAAYQMGPNTQIPGFDQGLKFMSKGGSALMIIPYQLAYGVDGNGYLNIPPYQTLLIDVQLLNIYNKK